MKHALVVKKSPIHGKGLFARKDFPEGTLLGYCKFKKSTDDGPHILTLNSGETVRVTCKFKYINHSKQPNVAYYDDLSVVVLTAIRKGEELTHDYGEAWTS